MAKPWEKYGGQAVAAAPEGPWSRYSGKTERSSAEAAVAKIEEMEGLKLSPDQREQAIRQQMAGTLNLQVPAKWSPTQRSAADLKAMAKPQNVTDDMSFLDNATAGFGKSFVDTAQGLKQLYVSATGDANENAQMQASVDQRRREDEALAGTGGGFAGNVAGSVTQMAVPIPGAAGVKSLAFAGKAAPYAKAAIQGGVFSGLQPVASDETRAGNAATGAAFGAAGQGIASGMGKAAKAAWDRLPAATREAIKAARELKIPLHVSQVTDSKPVKILGSVLNQLPFTGAANAVRKQQLAFNRAVAKTFGSDASQLTDEAMSAAKDKLGQAYDRIFAGKEISLDRQAVADLFALHRNAESILEAPSAAVVRKQIERIIDQAGESGSMPGKVYQSLRSELRKQFGKETGTGKAVMDARRVLDDAAKRSLGQMEGKALDRINSMWANLRTTQDALKQVGGAAGDVRPASLWALIRKGSTKDMRQLAKIGQTVLKDPIPDSGTVGRGAILGALGAGGYGGGGLAGMAAMAKPLAVAATAGRAMNSNTLSKALEQGKPINGLARLAQAAPRVLPALANQPRVAALVSAAVAQPERGPEIIANLKPEEQQAAIEHFAQQTGADPAEVAARVQAASARLAQLRQRN